MISNIMRAIKIFNKTFLFCGFGAGLSWSTVVSKLNNTFISKVYKTDREKLAVVNFLEQIAIADGEYHDKEKKLIAEIRDMLGV